MLLTIEKLKISKCYSFTVAGKGRLVKIEKLYMANTVKPAQTTSFLQRVSSSLVHPDKFYYCIKPPHVYNETSSNTFLPQNIKKYKFVRQLIKFFVLFLREKKPPVSNNHIFTGPRVIVFHRIYSFINI